MLIALTMLTSACFNPFYIGQAQPRQNHVPVVEVFPPPSNIPIAVPLGGCDQQELEVVSLEDADGDTLEARYDIVRSVGGTSKRATLRTFQALPPDGDGNFPDTDIGDIELTSSIANLGLTIEDDTQLIELRVSDSGFDVDGNETPIAKADGGLFFMSWMISVGQCP